jgi:hypothetical protein
VLYMELFGGLHPCPESASLLCGKKSHKCLDKCLFFGPQFLCWCQ